MSKRIPCRIVDLPSSIPVVEVGDAGKGLLVETSTSNKALPVRMSTAPGALRVSGLFTPASLPNLAAWYSADSGVLNSISPDVPATNGQTVRRWLDRSGNGRHLDQATLLNQPTFSGGRIVFTRASATSLLISGIVLPQPYSIYVVSRRTSTTAAQAIFGDQVVFTNTMQYASSTEVRIQTQAGQGINVASGVSSLEVVSAVANSAASEIRVNLGSPTIGNAGTPNLPLALSIGTNGGAQGLDGEICELCIYSGVVKSDALISALGRKWGVPL